MRSLPTMAAVLLFAGAAHAEPAADRRRELGVLLRQDCGSCHGLTLKGGLGPALLPETVGQKDAAWLRGVVLDGVPGTAMPPWRRLLSEADAAWLVGELQRGIEP